MCKREGVKCDLPTDHFEMTNIPQLRNRQKEVAYLNTYLFYEPVSVKVQI